jgi:hypothetical protein
MFINFPHNHNPIFIQTLDCNGNSIKITRRNSFSNTLKQIILPSIFFSLCASTVYFNLVMWTMLWCYSRSDSKTKLYLKVVQIVYICIVQYGLLRFKKYVPSPRLEEEKYNSAQDTETLNMTVSLIIGFCESREICHQLSEWRLLRKTLYRLILKATDSRQSHAHLNVWTFPHIEKIGLFYLFSMTPIFVFLCLGLKIFGWLHFVRHIFCLRCCCMLKYRIEENTKNVPSKQSLFFTFWIFIVLFSTFRRTLE